MQNRFKKIFIGLIVASMTMTGFNLTVMAQSHMFAQRNTGSGSCWSRTPSSGSYWYTSTGNGMCGQYSNTAWCNEASYSCSGLNNMIWTYNMQNRIDYWAEWYVWEPSRWQVYSNGYAFITDVNATTRNATYFNYYIFKPGLVCHGSVPYSGTTPDNANFVSHIDQLSYSDQWVRLWYRVAAVKCIDLVDWTGESNATKRVGFDEMKVEW